jgi:predicted lipid-binding transport protein (Tim44 family)
MKGDGLYGAALMGLIGTGIGGALVGDGFFTGFDSLAGVLSFAGLSVISLFMIRLSHGHGHGHDDHGHGGHGHGGHGHEAADKHHDSKHHDSKHHDGHGHGSGHGDTAHSAAAARPHADAHGNAHGDHATAITVAESHARSDLSITAADYADFERLLIAVETAYGNEDLPTLKNLGTPEMVAYFGQILAANSSRGTANRVSHVHLLQGDLVESWREDKVEHATVSMRFSLVDVIVDRSNGRVIEGNATQPVEVTEVWSFMRSPGGRWIMSGIQQV